tara:strand:+ start:310 stop:771 length:462 start_codon:yes stop_codon:yes gene_type:complete
MKSGNIIPISIKLEKNYGKKIAEGLYYTKRGQLIMADSLIQAMALKKTPPLDPNAFKPKSGGNLDAVLEGNIKGQDQNKEKKNAVQKIATFTPIRLKELTSDIASSTTQRKQASEIREAQSAIVTEKVKSTREQNPFSNPIERQAGKNLNITA